jgi:hypothetical protein
MMEVARTSETLVNVYQTTRRYNPEDSHLRTNRREILKSYRIQADQHTVKLWNFVIMIMNFLVTTAGVFFTS